RACDIALQRKGATLLLVLFTFADWFFSLLTVYFGFRAVGADLNPGLLAAGYTAGVIASTVSFIPGGLGIFEAAGILVYTMHGNMTADSVIAGLLIYRLAYYGIPLGLALPFLHFRRPDGTRAIAKVPGIKTAGRASSTM
ncbi:MAG: flippase-like domain-containing protein, partial [Rubrivivax sp.]